MTAQSDSAFELFERMKQYAPEYLDLFTSKTDEDFEAAFDLLLDKAIRHLEKNKVNFASLDEEGLSAVLVGRLSWPGLSVRQEEHSNGHVDIVIEAYLCTPMRTKLGEAKIYNGPAYHVDGLTQLLQRYTTGRESRGLLINYVRKRDIRSLIEKLRKQFDKDKPLKQQGATQNHTLKWSFVTTHKHDSGEELQVGHIGCNLHVGEGDKS